MAVCASEAGFVGREVGVARGGAVGVGDAANKNGVGICTSTVLGVAVGSMVGVENGTSFCIETGTVIS